MYMLCNSKYSPNMQLLAFLYAVLASSVIGVSASPIRQNQQDAAIHSPQILEEPGSPLKLHREEFDPVSPPPKSISTRSDDDNFAMSGNVERAFDTISPPPKILPPRTDDGDLSMSGVFLPPKINLSNDGRLPTIHARKDGFITVSPPSKVAPGDAGISARNTTFDPILSPPKVVSERQSDTISSPPKTASSDSKLSRRANIWSSGFIGNVINKWTGKSPTTPTNSGSGSGSGGLTPYQQNGPSKYGTPEMETLPKYYGGGTQTPWGGITTTNANPYKSCPLTGATRSYDFTIAECDIRPDGVETKKAVCVNGQFPGPLKQTMAT